MQAIFNGTVMVDGNLCFPRASMRNEFYRASAHTSVCGWTGTGRYWGVVVS
jgi:uncharacterized protein (DUF427 family)